MGKSLIIVESPAKIKTLKKFLGSDFLFESSIGHIRDLPQKEFGVDIDNDFEPKYVTLPDKEEVIAKLQRAAKQCDVVYLSPDPDREGEAIAWHISEILPQGTKYKRISFNAITKDEVLRALKHPRQIDFALVNAQQARRLLDRLVGYSISPILNRRIQRGKEGAVSAGRVQSVALKLVVDREKEIAAFVPIEHWNLSAILKNNDHEKAFKAYLYAVDSKRVEKEPQEGKDFTVINNKDSADAIVERMKKIPYKVKSVERKEKKRNPVPPFITSTLQQEASRHFGFSSARTMGIAQALYEGVDLGRDGAEGLITYMRTDSVRIAPEALKDARDHIAAVYGKTYLPESARHYTTKKSAQDAHEAIRPANLSHTPESVQRYLTKEQFILYQLIWRRFIASQMVSAVYDTVVADIDGGDKGIHVRAVGSTMKFNGFLAAYEEKQDDDDSSEENKALPPLEENMILNLQDIISEQAFTRPPPRYTEASLVKELEKSGIGRPSTYAAIMNKIQSRDYTTKENGRLKPTEIGQVIAQMLEDNFTQIMNVGFTSNMEDDLERIAENARDWKGLIREFWSGFSPTLETAKKEAFVPKIPTDIDCPTCGSKLQKIWFKNKYFYGCTRYPDCNFTAPVEELNFNKEEYAADFDWDQKCPKCSSDMKTRHGRFGAFLGCTRYPECNGIVNIPKKGEAPAPVLQQEVSCPAIGCDGHIVARKSRYGKTFYSCSTFPQCDVIVNDLDQLASKYPNHPKTAYVKKTKKGAKKKDDSDTKEKTKKTAAVKKSSAKKLASSKTATDKPKKAQPAMQLSQDLADVVGSNSLSRGEVMKKVWEYIKKNNLQDANNKRLICPDEKMKKIFGTKQPVDMFKMTALISSHIS